MGLGEFVSSVVASATGTRQRYEKKAAASLELIKELREQLCENNGHMSEHLQSIGFTREVKGGRKGNKYTKGDITILLYRKEQLKHYYDHVYPLIKENCCVANNKEYNCPHTYIAIIYKDKHYFFSPDYPEPRPLQVPRSLYGEHLKKIVDEISSEKVVSK